MAGREHEGDGACRRARRPRPIRRRSPPARRPCRSRDRRCGQRIGDVEHREPRRVLALDRDHEAVVAEPHRAPGLGELPRRAAFGGDDPDAALVGVGDGGAVRRQPWLGVLPVRHRIAAGREALRRSTAVTVELEQPHVGGVPVLDEHGRAPVGAHGQRPRTLGGGNRLEPPGGRRLQVLPRLRRDALDLVLAEPHVERFRHSHGLPGVLPTSRARARRSRRDRTRPPVRRRSAAPVGRSGAPPRRKPRTVTSSGLSGSPPAASTPSASTIASAPLERAACTSSSTARSHSSSRVPGGSGTLRFEPSPTPPPRSEAPPRKCGNQPVAGSMCTEAVKTSFRSQKIDWAPFP